MEEKETKRKKTVLNMDFLRQTGEWKKTLSQLMYEMTQQHKKLSEVPIKDYSTAVMYLDSLLTTIQFLTRAGETLDEYVLGRLEDSGFFSIDKYTTLLKK